MKENIISKLKKYNYSYRIIDNIILIDLKFNQTIKISFFEDKILITNFFRGLNILSGRLKFDINKTLVLQTIISIVGSLYFFVFTPNLYPNIIMFFVLTIYYHLLWFLFYLFRFYFIKKLIIDWIDNEVKKT